MYFWKMERFLDRKEKWNGEKYILGNGKSYRPVYRQLDEDDYEIIGYIED